MNVGFSRRGQPLIALFLLLGCWVSARAMMWESKPAPHIRPFIASTPFIDPDELRGPKEGVGGSGGIDEQATGVPAPMSVPPLRGRVRLEAYPAEPVEAGVIEAIRQPAGPGRLAAGPTEPAPMAAPPPAPVALPPPPAIAPVPARTTIGHHLLWMAALARVPMPASLTAGGELREGAQRLGADANATQPGLKRWSADGWILWRRGGSGASSGALLTPSYGASQAGAVVRYRLAPSSPLRPAAYLRTTAALNGSSEREAALGLQVRPIRGLPLALAGEARMTAVPGRTFVRPAVFAVTELAPFALPMGLRAEAYGQAGYVGGRFATGFADGQLRVDRRIVALGQGDIRLGGGVWGGVQKGASRVDAGPTLTFGRPLGASGSMRLAADWRFRVAGKAAPGSGPAVTLSAGF